MIILKFRLILKLKLNIILIILIGTTFRIIAILVYISPTIIYLSRFSSYNNIENIRIFTEIKDNNNNRNLDYYAHTYILLFIYNRSILCIKYYNFIDVFYVVLIGISFPASYLFPTYNLL